jgi:hypothetical protein
MRKTAYFESKGSCRLPEVESSAVKIALRKVYTGNEGYAHVFESEEGTLYLVNLCGGIVWAQIGIVMNAEEKTAFIREPSSIDTIAQRMCRDFKPFEGREIPEAIRSSLV